MSVAAAGWRGAIALGLSLALIVGLAGAGQAYPRPGLTERASVGPDGAEADGEPKFPAISADGRFVVFESKATNLVPGDTNEASDVFLRDLTTGTTELISVALDGGVGDQESLFASISADGRFVAFTSEATNLVAQDANGEADIFVRDRAAGTTRLVSEGIDGTPASLPSQDMCDPGAQANLSFRPSVSADGERVAFGSWAGNLVPDDNNGCPDIFVRDLATGTTERVSVSTEGEESNAVSVEPTISGDGTVVVFESFATNLVPAAETGDVNLFTAAVRHAFVRDLAEGTTERVSVSSEGEPANSWVWGSTVTHDGAEVVFSSSATNLVPADTETNIDVFVHDRDTGRTERVSTGSDGREGNDNAGNEKPAVSADGRYVAFSSDADNLAGEDRNVRIDVFVHDRLIGETQRVSLSSDGAEADGSSRYSALSADGRRVVFLSTSTNLVAQDSNGEIDVFVRDRGPEVGILDLEAERELPEGVRVSGRATFAGVELTTASDPAGDGAEDLGADLIGARVAARPESEDLFVRWDLTGMPVIRREGNTDLTVAGAPGVVYGLSFEAGGVPHEVRAGGTNVTSTFSLWRCEIECSQVAPLSGSIGTVDAAVVVAVPRDALPAATAMLSDVRAWIDLGDVAAPAGEIQDEVAMPDGSVPTATVDLGVALDHIPREEVAFEAGGVLQDGSFSGIVHASSLAGGNSHRAWARACLQGTCGHVSAPVPGPGPPDPDPTPSPTALEPRFFFHSGGTPVNQADKLPSGHATFDMAPPTSDQPSVGPDTSVVVNTSPGGGGDPTWTGSIGTPFDSLTLDFWQKAPLHEVVAAATGSTAIGAFYDVQVFVGDEPVVLPGFNAYSDLADVATRVTHTFTTMLDDTGQEVPLFIDPAGQQVTISINGGLLEWEAATVILYDSTDYPSGFSVEGVTVPTPTATPSPSFSVSPPTGSRGTYPISPDDPYWGDSSSLADFEPVQWAPQLIQASEAWQESRATGHAIRVAVLDTGVDLEHEDLQCDGKLEVVPDSDVVAEDSTPDDEHSHGTHVAGIIGACTNNGIGVAGVAPDATVVPFRVLDAAGNGTDAQLIAGINGATAAGVHVINMSLSYPPGKDIVNDVRAIDAAIEAAADAGVVLVAAAGNESAPLCNYPALAEDLVCVGATDARDAKAVYSNFPVKPTGPALVAPGGSGAPFCDTYVENVLSTIPLEADTNGCTDVQGYANNFGTSMASPHVAGVAALIYDRVGGSRSPDNAQSVIDALLSSVEDLGTPGYDPVFGEGRVNAVAAVQAVDDPDPDPTPTPTATTDPTESPTTDPTESPTTDPTESPTTDPSETPTTDPTESPTTDPTESPTTDPGPSVPEAPSNLTARAASSSRIELAWTDNSTTESGFAIERSSDGNDWQEIATAGRNATMHLDLGLDPDTTYSYRVRALNPSGYSDYSNAAAATTMSRQSSGGGGPTNAPATPSNLRASPASPSRIELSWTDNSNNEDGFALERSSDGTTWQEITSTASNQTTYLDAGLAADTTYHYRVRAYNSSGHSGYSTRASATTQKAPSGGDEPSPAASDPPVRPATKGTATTSIAASRTKTSFNRGVELSGSVERDDNCTGPLEVEVSRRIHGTDSYESVASTAVNGAGAWGLQVVGRHNASYIAQVKDTDACHGDPSVPTDVLVRVKVAAKTPRSCDGGEVVRGKVRPNHKGTRVILQQRTRNGWRKVDTDALNKRSRFVLRVRRCGLHRIVWRAQDVTNQWGATKLRP